MLYIQKRIKYSIKELNKTYKEQPTLFTTIKSTFETIKKIFIKNEIEICNDDRILNLKYKDSYLDNEIHIIGFKNGCSGSNTYKNVELCETIVEFRDNMAQVNNITIFACSFNWDSSSCILLGGYQCHLGDACVGCYYLERFLIKNYISNDRRAYW